MSAENAARYPRYVTAEQLMGNETITQPDYKIGYGDYLRFRELVLQRTGLNFHEKKRSDLEIGLLKALAESSLAATVDADGKYDLDRYYNLLANESGETAEKEMQRLINILTVGETHFFRDEAQFSALTSQVFPALIARKRAAAAAIGPDIQPQLRIWSVGCASGEEPYSIAILLKETLPDIDNWYVQILATDINQNALGRAEKAVYSDWSFREPRAKALRPRYFTRYVSQVRNADPGFRPAKDRYRLRDDIRQMVTFARLNLIEDDYPAIQNNTVSMDLILCRNVTIYFTEEVTRMVIHRLHESLIDGGWLVVGHSEPSLTVYRAFQMHMVANTVLYQKTGRSYDPLHNRLGFRQSRPRITDTGPLPTPPPEPAIIATTRINGKTGPLLDVTPTEPDLYEVARVLVNKGYTQEAIDELHRKLADTSDFAPAHSLLGRAYANLGRWKEARYWCESALKLDSLQAEAYYVLSSIFQHEGDLEGAIDMLKKAIYLDREAPLLHFSLALLYKKSGQVQKSRRTCKNTIRVLEKWPPASIVPDSGGATAKHLLEAARRIMGELETG